MKYSYEEITKANVLEILEIEKERAERGIPYRQIISLLYRDSKNNVSLQEVIDSLEQDSWIKKTGKFKDKIKITREGKKQLSQFFQNIDKESSKIFQRQRPFSSELFVRVQNIEILFGSFLMLLVFGGLLALTIYLQLQNKVDFHETLFFSIVTLFSIATLAMYVNFIVAFSMIAINGVVAMVSKISFNISYWFMKNAKILQGGFIVIALVGLVLVGYSILGWKGLIGTAIFEAIFFIIKRWKNIAKKINEFNQKRKDWFKK